jgi:hypothetical protein
MTDLIDHSCFEPDIELDWENTIDDASPSVYFKKSLTWKCPVKNIYSKTSKFTFESSTKHTYHVDLNTTQLRNISFLIQINHVSKSFFCEINIFCIDVKNDVKASFQECWDVTPDSTEFICKTNIPCTPFLLNLTEPYYEVKFIFNELPCNMHSSKNFSIFKNQSKNQNHPSLSRFLSKKLQNIEQTSSQLPKPVHEFKVIGLHNLGATCYLNSVLQALFHLPIFRKKIYLLPFQQEKHSLINSLQNLFIRLQFHQSAVSTYELTKSFGWSSYDIIVQQDVHEFFQFFLMQ